MDIIKMSKISWSRHSIQVFQLIDEELSEGLDLVDVELWRFGSEGHTFRCVQHKEQIHRTLCRKTEVESQNHLWFKNALTVCPLQV